MEACLLRRCRMSKEDRIFSKGYRLLEREIQVDQLLKTLRILKGIVRKKLSVEEWLLAKARYGFKSQVTGVFTNDNRFKSDDNESAC